MKHPAEHLGSGARRVFTNLATDIPTGTARAGTKHRLIGSGLAVLRKGELEITDKGKRAWLDYVRGEE